MKTLALILAFLLAFAIGVVVGMLIDKDNVYNAQIKKIKQRGEGNILESIFTPILGTKQDERKQKRKERREARRARKNNVN